MALNYINFDAISIKKAKNENYKDLIEIQADSNSV